MIATTVCGALQGSPPTVVRADSINERGEFVAGLKTDIALSPELSGVFRAAAEDAVATVRAAGGYLPVHASQPPALPQPPASGETPDDNELVGEWRGTIRLNVPGSMSVTFTRNTTTHADGSAQIRIGSTVLDTSLERLAVADGLISFDVPLGSQGEFRFDGAFIDGKIRGVGSLVLGGRTTALGRVELERATP